MELLTELEETADEDSSDDKEDKDNKPKDALLLEGGEILVDFMKLSNNAS